METGTWLYTTTLCVVPKSQEKSGLEIRWSTTSEPRPAAPRSIIMHHASASASVDPVAVGPDAPQDRGATRTPRTPPSRVINNKPPQQRDIVLPLRFALLRSAFVAFARSGAPCSCSSCWLLSRYALSAALCPGPRADQSWDQWIK